MKGAGRAGRLATAACLVVVAVLGVATARELGIGQREVESADAAAERSDWPEAVLHARAAAEALVPGSPWPARGWERLEAIGHDAEARGDDPTALLAYGAMRAAALATTAPGAGTDVWRGRAEDGLARVAASTRSPTGPRTTSDAMLDALRGNETPPTGRLVLLGAAAAAMLGGLARLAWASTPAKARVAQAAAALGLVGYAIVVLTS
jgi:hypothetical protein